MLSLDSPSADLWQDGAVAGGQGCAGPPQGTGKPLLAIRNDGGIVSRMTIFVESVASTGVGLKIVMCCQLPTMCLLAIVQIAV